MEKNLKITNKKQMEKLLDLMTENPDIGSGKLPFGFSKMQFKEKWDAFTLQLNSLGPPIRTPKEWQRVWTHHKANLKRKLAANKRNFQATGGGPSTEVSLSPLEQSTIELVSIHSQINPNRLAMGLQRQEDSDSAESILIQAQQHSPVLGSSQKQQTPKSRSNAKNKIEEERLKILKEQAKNQELMLKCLRRLENNSYKNYQINKQLLELKQKKTDMQVELMKAKLELTRLRMQM